jgi:putative DNA primase/helicase
LRFDHTASRWFRFDGQHWQREETHLAKHYARDISTTLAAGNPRAKALKRVSNWEAIERGARTACEFACIAKIWDSDAFLLGTPGGTVDLKTGKLRKARPSDYISKITASAPVPLHSLNPARDCPHWLTFLQEALDRDADAIRFLQQWGGYNLTGVTREHALVFVYGPGGSGKSTAINTIADVIGDHSINVSTSTLTAAKHDAHSEELARLDGPRLAWASETEKGRAWAENRVKSLTGPVLWSEREIRSLPIKAYDDSRSLRISALARKRRRYCCIDCRIVGTELNRATKPLTLGGGMLIITKS